jgi:ribosomal protein S18 acetylase RimI-like enzyme
MNYKLLTRYTGADLQHSNAVITDFLHEHLGKYGDDKSDILRAIEYVFNPKKPGGNIILRVEEGLIIGAVVLNETGMVSYIPENILVYIAVHSEHQGKGIGKELMQNAIKLTKGDIALHVEPDNPAIFLYEKVGFNNKYLEMRYKRRGSR